MIEANERRFVATVDTISLELRHGRHVMRCTGKDDFGLPETTFPVCRFRPIDALWLPGRTKDARAMFQDALRHRDRHGLPPEDVAPTTGMPRPRS